tara:strand:+ start:6058 stop:6957 length:900 start_codon:yes stop_codon:yes gene_type:complete
MDLLSYLQTGSQPKPIKKRKGKKRKKIKWGTPHPKTGFKSFANKPTTQMDKLLTTITASLLQNPADKIRQKEALADYGYVMPIDEARAKVKKFSSAPDEYEDLEEEAARKLAKGKIKEKDIDEFLMDRGQQESPLRADYLGREYNLDQVANDYGKKWEVIDRELDDLFDTLNTGGGVETMRKEALQDLKKKRNDLFKQGLEQEEFMLIGLTDTNKTYRNKFKDTFGKGQLQEYQNNINMFAGRLGQIDDLLDIKREEAYDFDLKEAMDYSQQEAQEELNLLDLEIEENLKLFDSSRIKD